MPVALGGLLFALGAPVAVVNFFAIGFGATLLTVGASLGLSYLAQAVFRPQVPQPKPEDVQQSTRQPAQVRVRHYGRNKVSGPWVMAAAKEGNFHKVLALGVGPFAAIEEYWIDDVQVTLNGTGGVQTAPWTNRVRILTRLGEASESYYAELEATFSEWTSSHRGDGVASLYATQYSVAQEDYLSTFPNGISTNYRVVARCAELIPFGGGTPAWDDNAAAVIYDYMRSDEGMRLPASITDTTEALAGWSTAFSRCGESVSLKAGGSEERYRLWGSYRLDERPADVLSRMLACCDGMLMPTSDGGLTVDIGDHPGAPDVTLTADDIVAFSDVSRGRNVLDTANTINGTYMEPEADYQTQDADPWVDAADVSARGEISADFSFIMSPSHGQTRRLLKQTYYRANPNWVGVFECQLTALRALGHRFVGIQIPALGIDEVFEIRKFDFNIVEGDKLRSVILQVQSMPAAAYEWTAASEEGDRPVTDSVTVDNTIPVPTGLTLTYNTSTTNLEVEANTPPVASLSLEYRIKPTAGTDWTTFSPAGGETLSQVSGLVDGTEYEVQARHKSATGRTSAWTSSATITITSDTSAPADVTLNSATGGSGQVTLNWTTPNSPNFNRVVIKRGTTATEGAATEISASPVYGSPNTTYEIDDTGLAAGDYYYWIYAQNGSGVDDGSGVASGAVTVS